MGLVGAWQSQVAKLPSQDVSVMACGTSVCIQQYSCDAIEPLVVILCGKS